MRAGAQALPAVEYNKDPADWDWRRVAPDLALLVLVLMYTIMTVLDFRSGFRMCVPAPSCLRSNTH